MKDDLTSKIRNRYNRVAPIFHKMDSKMMRSWRRELLSTLKGNVLEVGIGTGANLPYYPTSVTLTGIDFSPNMLQYARERASELRLKVDLKEMDAQNMDFQDNTFDYVVATCVYCSVPDPVQGMKEMLRVCKPDGRVILLEHMRSENPVIGKVMDILNPITVRVSGANINRRTLDNIGNAGFTFEKNECLFSTIFRRLVLNPNKEPNNNEGQKK
ncbi:class I SAM-dependent methyltransferase [Paenibacillus lutimineralis]|uniref:Class I SAM-dependent methyltransferase n=1 Tax=Paenibacillus lutimineralis TaxID=2707005 RepID=A0A3Q9I941_9BACL|nr:class I SAM-dependent methyltransferase [Paenibacillus lutimineralis]AZS15498.1 class I SAM-dependent methyltransferase [Paenibacillus lutimineralis]